MTHGGDRLLAAEDQPIKTMVSTGDPGIPDVTFCTCDTGPLMESVIDLAELAMWFGAINRTAVFHPDRRTPESDSDHTVMLAWIAPALAARFQSGLDIGLVAQFAVVHDAPEVYAGDTPTLRIDAAGQRTKAAREAAAVQRLAEEFTQELPWFPLTVARYERQDTPEARYVRALDKVIVKAVHLLDGCHGLVTQGVTPEELDALCARQRPDIMSYAGEFAEVLALYDALLGRARAMLAARLAAVSTPCPVCGYEMRAKMQGGTECYRTSCTGNVPPA